MCKNASRIVMALKSMSFFFQEIVFLAVHIKPFTFYNATVLCFSIITVLCVMQG